jgi:ribosomal protein S24E
MDKTINVTKKLLKIVKQRKTPLVVNKQDNSYKKNRSVGKNLSYESYSNDSND